MGLPGGHVRDDAVDGFQLVGCLVEGESFGEGLVIEFAELECVALARGAARIDIQEFRRHVPHLFGGAAPGLLPLAAAQSCAAGRSPARCRCNG